MIECCATEIILQIRSSICQIVIDRIQLFFGRLYSPRKLYIMRSGIDVIKQLLQVGVLFAIQVWEQTYYNTFFINESKYKKFVWNWQKARLKYDALRKIPSNIRNAMLKTVIDITTLFKKIQCIFSNFPIFNGSTYWYILNKVGFENGTFIVLD